MIIAKLLIIFFIIIGIGQNISKWGEAKESTYGGIHYIISLIICIILYWFAGIFEPLTKIFQ